MKVVNSLVRVGRVKFIKIQIALAQTCFHDDRASPNSPVVSILN